MMLTRRVLFEFTCLCLVISRVESQIAGGSATQVCRTNQDIIFLLDSSGAIGVKMFQKLLDQIVLLSEFTQPIGQQAKQIGVEVFATKAKTEIRLKDHNSFNTLKKAIMKIKYTGGPRYTHRGLNHMCRIGFSSRNGDRKNVGNLGILIIHGSSTRPLLTIRAANRCRAKGIKLLVIPIGTNVNMEELIAITGSKNPIATLPNIAELNNVTTSRFLQNMTGLRCIVSA